MAIMDLLNINLSKIPSDGMKLEMTLDGDFFTALDQETIKGGNVKVNLNIREHSGEVYTLKFVIQGEVIVECDRCLDDLALVVDAEETIKLTYNDESDSTADDIKFIPKNTNMYDASWDVYEIVELSLPIQRTHQVGECNEDMLGRICYENDECLDE